MIAFCTAIRIYSYKWEGWDPIDWFSPATCFVSVAFRGLDFWIHVVVHFYVQWVGRRGDCSLSWCCWNCKPSLLKLYLLIDLYLRCMSISACQYSLYLWMKICGLIKQLNVFNPHFFKRSRLNWSFYRIVKIYFYNPWFWLVASRWICLFLFEEILLSLDEYFSQIPLPNMIYLFIVLGMMNLFDRVSIKYNVYTSGLFHESFINYSNLMKIIHRTPV